MHYNYRLTFFSLLIGLFSTISAQSNATISEVFFLDLGIVIEPTTGDEKYNRVVEAPSEEINFQIKKVKSGSIYMAASSEMLASLERINSRIEKLEVSFQEKLHDLQHENQLLKTMITDLNNSSNIANEMANTNTDKPVLSFEESKEKEESIVTSLNAKIVKKPEKVINELNMNDYMSGVFAYQQNKFKLAIKYFSNLSLTSADKNISDNVVYWMADSYQQIGDIDNAMIYLDKVLQNHSSDHIDDALIKKGLLHRKRGEADQSLIVFNELVNNFPDSEYVKLARMEIKRAEMYQ